MLYLYSLMRFSSASCSAGDTSPSSTPINAPFRSFVKRSLKDVLVQARNSGAGVRSCMNGWSRRRRDKNTEL